MSINNYKQYGSIYAKHSLGRTGYLAFKYIPFLIKKYTKGKKTLDYGCGAGRSSRFLYDLGLDVEAVDTSCEMIEEAKRHDSPILYQTIESAKILNESKRYDLVFSSLVMFEISSITNIIKISLD